MTGEEAVETLIREAAEAGVVLGPVGKQAEFQKRVAEVLNDDPRIIPHYLAAARRQIEWRKGLDGPTGED